MSMTLRLLDVLPLRLWHPTNWYLGGLHFCVASGEPYGLSDSVRTVEWRGRELVHGKSAFPHDEWCRRWPTDDGE